MCADLEGSDLAIYMHFNDGLEAEADTKAVIQSLSYVLGAKCVPCYQKGPHGLA